MDTLFKIAAWVIGGLYLVAVLGGFAFMGIFVALAMLVLGGPVVVKTCMVVKNRDGHLMGRLAATFAGGFLGLLAAPLVAALVASTGYLSNLNEGYAEHDSSGLVAAQGAVGFIGYGLLPAMALLYTFGPLRPHSSPFRDHGIGDMIVSFLVGFVSICIVVAIPLMQHAAATS